MQSLVKSASTRIVIQQALGRYNAGNNTAANWARSITDLSAVFQGGQQVTLMLQAQVYAKNDSGLAGRTPVVQATGDDIKGTIALPYFYPNGSQAYLGDSGADSLGYPSLLYPNLTFTERYVNQTFNTSIAWYDGQLIDQTHALFLGPWQLNNSFALVSMTVPIINNTSSVDILGWLTMILDARLISDIVAAAEGLDKSGVTMVIGPQNSTNKFPNGVLSGTNDGNPPEEVLVNFKLPATYRQNQTNRHAEHDFGSANAPFNYADIDAIKQGLTVDSGATNYAGSMISTSNENGDKVAIGYARPNTSLVDWIVLVEQTHTEVWGPINHLRTILLACVFGTVGGMILLAFPIAHYSSRPIRRLRDATRKSIDPPGFGPHDSDSQLSGDVENEQTVLARKEGLVGYFRKITGRDRISSAERQEAERRRHFRIPGKVKDRKHFIHDELTDLTQTFNEMTDELMMQYEKLEERVAQRTAELELSKKAAEAANESKTLFIANISHELKTPLNGILGMCAVCMSEEDPIKLKRSLGIIYKSGDLLLNLLTDLLTFSKNQVGQNLSLDEKEFRLRDISSQILAIFDKQAKESEISLQVKFQGPVEANLDDVGGISEKREYAPFGLGRVKDMILWGDQHRILQVVINLVSNSLKFTPKGGKITLTIRCTGDAAQLGSRKSSMHSGSGRNSRTRSRLHTGSESSIGTDRLMATANEINPMEKTGALAQILAQERAQSPPPGRNLAFEFVVEDTGPGIPEHLQQRIFEPFVQGDLGLTKKFGGTGLGLSICSQLAGLMKGTIALESEVGQGSIFTMQIPLRHLLSRADSTASSSVTDFNSRRSSAERSRIGQLRVDDDAISARSVQSVNSNSGPVTFESDSKPRLVGLSQPFFASNPPMESSSSQKAAMDRVTAEATKREDKVRVLVAEDNKTNQEVVLRMLKLEDIYDVTVAKGTFL